MGGFKQSTVHYLSSLNAKLPVAECVESYLHAVMVKTWGRVWVGGTKWWSLQTHRIRLVLRRFLWPTDRTVLRTWLRVSHIYLGSFCTKRPSVRPSTRPHLWFPTPINMLINFGTEMYNGSYPATEPSVRHICRTAGLQDYTGLTGFYRNWFKPWKKKVMFYVRIHSVP